MGSENFTHIVHGKTAKEAFHNAKEEAYYDHGHAGYTGTIAEKSDFVTIELPEGKTPEQYADELIENSDPRIDDKWGPAGCIHIKGDEYLFFGWASC